jgi:hypothetical protein
VTQQYKDLSEYYTNLSERHRLREEWKARHPDWQTDQFQNEADEYYSSEEREGMVFKSSFDPTDVPPTTADVFTAEMLLNIMAVALQAWEKKND